MSQIASFRAKLSLLTDYLDDPGITEVAINRPGEVWIGRQGQRYMQHADVPELNYRLLESLAAVRLRLDLALERARRQRAADASSAR